MKYSINIELNKPNTKNEASILFRLRVNNKRISISSGLIIPVNTWDKHNKRILGSFKNSKTYNSLLDKYKSEIEQVVIRLNIAEQAVNKKAITNQLSFTTQKVIENKFDKYFDLFISSKQVEVSKNTIGKYKLMYRTINKVAKINSIHLSFENIDDKFYTCILEYLYNEKELSSNGVNAYIKNLKVFLSWCFDKGYNKKVAFQKFKVPKYEPEIFPLFENEIKLLEKFKGSASKEKVRDIFLFQTYTGLRFGDAQDLIKEQINENAIVFMTQKTKDRLVIPLTNKTRSILQKYVNTNNKGFVLPQISNQKANKILKQLAKEAGLTREIVYHERYGIKTVRKKAKLFEKIATHDARRTFITYNLSKGMNAQMIMAMTGHKDYKSFERYVNINENDISKLLNTIWND